MIILSKLPAEIAGTCKSGFFCNGRNRFLSDIKLFRKPVPSFYCIELDMLPENSGFRTRNCNLFYVLPEVDPELAEPVTVIPQR